MKRILLSFALLVFIAVRCFAVTHIIVVSNDVFSPSSLPTVHLGDTILWQWSAGTHTTTSTSIPGGAASWNSPVNSTTTSFMYIPTVIGTYNYQCNFHVSMGMIGSFVVSTAVGVAEISKVQGALAIFPNPASSNLHILYHSKDQPVSVTITDMNGREILKKKYNVFSDADIDVKDIPNGDYILSVCQRHKVLSQRLTIAH